MVLPVPRMLYSPLRTFQNCVLISLVVFLQGSHYDICTSAYACPAFYPQILTMTPPHLLTADLPNPLLSFASAVHSTFSVFLVFSWSCSTWSCSSQPRGKPPSAQVLRTRTDICSRMAQIPEYEFENDETTKLIIG